MPKKLVISTIAIATAMTLGVSTSASAHVSVLPGVTASGSSTAALTAGQSGTLYFRVGHGCTDETGIKVNLETIRFEYKPTQFRIVDNGHTLQVAVGEVAIVGATYNLREGHVVPSVVIGDID